MSSLKCWLLLCCVAASRQLSIKEFVVPNAVQAGQDVELKCSYELNSNETEEAIYFKWWMISLDTEKNRTLFYQRISGVGVPGTPIKHNVEKKEHDSIVLLNVSAANSGIYECEVNIGYINETRRNQELIVYTQGTGPELNVTTIADGPDEDEQEDVLIECEASGVAPLPDFIVTVDGTEVKNLNEYVAGPDGNGLYDIYGNTTVSMAEANGADVRCELVFIHPNVTHQPYVASKLFYPSGAGSTTEMPEDATVNTTPESLQDSGDHGSIIQASWMTMLIVGILECLNSLL